MVSILGIAAMSANTHVWVEEIQEKFFSRESSFVTQKQPYFAEKFKNEKLANGRLVKKCEKGYKLKNSKIQ